MKQKHHCFWRKSASLCLFGSKPRLRVDTSSPCTAQTSLFCLRRRRRRMSKLAPFSSRCDEKSGLWASEIFKFMDSIYDSMTETLWWPLLFWIGWSSFDSGRFHLVTKRRTFIRVPWVWAKIVWQNDEPCGFGKARDTNISNMALGQGISSSQTVQIPEETCVYHI